MPAGLAAISRQRQFEKLDRLRIPTNFFDPTQNFYKIPLMTIVKIILYTKCQLKIIIGSKVISKKLFFAIFFK